MKKKLYLGVRTVAQLILAVLSNAIATAILVA